MKSSWPELDSTSKAMILALALQVSVKKPAQSNAPLVNLLESLGCIIIAKTNIPQTLASLDSVNNVFWSGNEPL